MIVDYANLTQQLYDYGIDEQYSGFYIIKKAILYMLEKDEYMTLTHIHEELSNYYDTHYSNIEGRIYSAIKCAYKKSNYDSPMRKTFYKSPGAKLFLYMMKEIYLINNVYSHYQFVGAKLLMAHGIYPDYKYYSIVKRIMGIQTEDWYDEKTCYNFMLDFKAIISGWIYNNARLFRDKDADEVINEISEMSIKNLKEKLEYLEK